MADVRPRVLDTSAPGCGLSQPFDSTLTKPGLGALDAAGRRVNTQQGAGRPGDPGTGPERSQTQNEKGHRNLKK